MAKAIVFTLCVMLTVGNLPALTAAQSPIFNRAQMITLTARALSQTQIALNWSITNPGSIIAVRIYRAAASDPASFAMVTALPAGATSYVDQGLLQNQAYSYYVRTVAGGGVLMSVPSNTATAATWMGNGMPPSPPAPTTPTPAPTPAPMPVPTPDPTPADSGATPVNSLPGRRNTLTAAALSETQVQLTWQLISMARVGSVQIYRAVAAAPSTFTLVTAVSPSPNRFIDTGLSPGTTYLYQVKVPAGGGALLQPPTNVVTATTLGGARPNPTPAPTPTATPAPTPAPAPTATPTPTPGTPKPTPSATPVPPPNGGPGGAIPLDDEEEKLLGLINAYREGSYLGRVRPSIALTKSSDFLSRDLATRGTATKYDSSGRDVATRARAFGYQTNTSLDAVVAAGNLSAQQAMNEWLAAPDATVLANPMWKVAGVARTYNASMGKWFWVVELAGYWDKTIPIPGEDDDGAIDGNPMIRTRPPGAAIALGHRFTGYNEDGQSRYSPLHCDLDNPGGLCWRDEPPQGNPSLKLPSLPDNLVGTWHVQYSISPTGVVHFNDYKGYDGTGFTINFYINANGTWATQGYRAYQVPTPSDSGTWTSVHDAERDEEIVTFTRKNGPTATIRIHATRNVLTLFVVEGGAAMKSFLKGVPADANPKDDPQLLLTPGIGYFNAPHEPFPGQGTCTFCPKL